MAAKLSIRDELLGCIIGLSRVCQMHQKSDRTDLLILQGLIDSADLSLSDGTIQSTMTLIKSEKSKIAPMCETCAARCGNSDDYDMNKLYDDTEEIRKLKLKILHKIQDIAKESINLFRMKTLDEQTITYFHKALFAISENWDENQLSLILNESLNHFNV